MNKKTHLIDVQPIRTKEQIEEVLVQKCFTRNIERQYPVNWEIKQLIQTIYE